MILRRSRFVHVLQLAPDRFLAVHALTQMRLGLDREAAGVVAWFDAPRRLPEDVEVLKDAVGYDLETLAKAIGSLLERGVLSQATPEEEMAASVLALSETQGRDPGEMLQRYRRAKREGVEDYWAMSTTRDLAALAAGGRRVDIILLGDCDVQMEANFLAEEGRRRGLDLRVAASFHSDPDFVAEHPHDLVILGALSSRVTIASGGRGPSHEIFLEQAKTILSELRARTRAPILFDGLPEPTVLPLGLADSGPDGYRNKFRRANLALDELAQTYSDVHVVDVAATLAAAGSSDLLDDGLTSFTHFGSPGWMLQRPSSELAAVHHLFPDMEPLADQLGGDPYRRERTLAAAHIDMAITLLGIDQKKCVVVDLDGVLWPGVLAETGAPFAWSPETSGPYSYIGLYFGLHEALKTLKRRGVVLAAVSKNDEAVVRDLWTYPDFYPRERLLTPEDFVTWRVNWVDKAENVLSIANELGFALETFLFIDDHPVERERMRIKAPEIEVWGDDLFVLRRRLLSDPRLQSARLTEEAESRTSLVKAQLERARLRGVSTNEDAFLASLNVSVRIETLTAGASIDRVQELLSRTTQFNTMARMMSKDELSAMLVACDAGITVMFVADRFGDHGLVGAAISEGPEILAFAMSCRVIGMGVEHRLLDAVLDALASAGHGSARATLVETPRNAIVRHLYRDAGFLAEGGGRWTMPLAGRRAIVRKAAREVA